jgi:hypothetical protein
MHSVLARIIILEIVLKALANFPVIPPTEKSGKILNARRFGGTSGRPEKGENYE